MRVQKPSEILRVHKTAKTGELKMETLFTFPLEPIPFVIMLSTSMLTGVVFGVLAAKLILWSIN
jgi:hypothetical protein